MEINFNHVCNQMNNLSHSQPLGMTLLAAGIALTIIGALGLFALTSNLPPEVIQALATIGHNNSIVLFSFGLGAVVFSPVILYRAYWYLSMEKSEKEMKAVVFKAVDENKPNLLADPIRKGFDFNIRDGDQTTPLHYAADLNIATILVNNGARLDAQDSVGYTPLHTVLCKKKAELALFYIQKMKTDAFETLLIQNKFGNTPLHFAVIYGRNSEALALIEAFKGHPDWLCIKNRKKQTPLDRAIEGKTDPKVINALKEAQQKVKE